MVEPAVVYGVSVGETEAFVRSCHFDLEYLRRLVVLGVNSCVSAYPSSDEEESIR